MIADEQGDIVERLETKKKHREKNKRNEGHGRWRGVEKRKGVPV